MARHRRQPCPVRATAKEADTMVRSLSRIMDGDDDEEASAEVLIDLAGS